MSDVKMDPPIVGTSDLTPWELRNGRWYKMEHYCRNAYGVNGTKYRLARHMISGALLEGYDHVVSASSVLSPQAAISATIAEELGMGCTIVLGASKPETASKHPSVRIALEAGAMLDTSCRVGYNPVLQPHGARLAEAMGAWQMPYGITPPDGRLDCLDIGGDQVQNLPPEVTTLLIPFGSGNTTAGVIHGLLKHGHENVTRIVLVGVGPDRTQWLYDRLSPHLPSPLFRIDHMPLHGWFADYGDRMPETVDEIIMHPTYEGKVVRFLNQSTLDWWHDRDGSVGFWIVGGPFDG